MLIIKNSHGQYWTGECWGVKEAAQEYETADDLPWEVDGLHIDTWATVRNEYAEYYIGDNVYPSAKAERV